MNINIYYIKYSVVLVLQNCVFNSAKKHYISESLKRYKCKATFMNKKATNNYIKLDLYSGYKNKKNQTTKTNAKAKHTKR